MSENRKYEMKCENCLKEIMNGRYCKPCLNNLCYYCVKVKENVMMVGDNTPLRTCDDCITNGKRCIDCDEILEWSGGERCCSCAYDYEMTHAPKCSVCKIKDCENWYGCDGGPLCPMGRSCSWNALGYCDGDVDKCNKCREDDIIIDRSIEDDCESICELFPVEAD